MQHQGFEVQSDREPTDGLASLGERIRRARSRGQANRPAKRETGSGPSLVAIMWRMFADLLAGILVGLGLGLGLDTLLGTTPWFLIGMGLLGMAGGIRLAMRTAKEANGDGDRG